MAGRVVVARNSIEAMNQPSLDPWGCFVAMKGLVLELLAMPLVQPLVPPVDLPSSWCGLPCWTRSLFLLLRVEVNTKEGINVVEGVYVFIKSKGTSEFAMFVGLKGFFAGEAVRDSGHFLSENKMTGVLLERETLKRLCLEGYAAMLVLLVSYLEVGVPTLLCGGMPLVFSWTMRC